MTGMVLKDEFQRLNQIVKTGLERFMEVGIAMRQIQQDKLYKSGGFSTWDDYCKSELSFSGRHASKLIQAADIAEQFDLTNQEHARRLQEVPKAERDEVISRARERMGESMTGSMIQDMAEEVRAERVVETLPGEPVAATVSQGRPDTSVFDVIDNHLVEAGKLLKKLAESQAGCFIQYSIPRADMVNTINYLRTSKPTVRCYACGGRGTDCSVCKGLGWTTTEMFDRRPEEFE